MPQDRVSACRHARRRAEDRADGRHENEADERPGEAAVVRVAPPAAVRAVPRVRGQGPRRGGRDGVTDAPPITRAYPPAPETGTVTPPGDPTPSGGESSAQGGGRTGLTTGPGFTRHDARGPGLCCCAARGGVR